MRLNLRHFLPIFISSATLGLSAQSITTVPALINENTKEVTITFHSDGGNRGLAGASATTEVYAHTGVITNLSDGQWKNAPTWGDNQEKYKLSYTGPFTWELKIPDLREYYGITASDERIEKLAFVFRSASSDMECKTGAGGDIFVQIFPSNFPASKAADYPGGIPKMGSVINSDGSVTFCLAAPGKNTVVMMGSWNDYTPAPEYVMNYQDYNGTRYFWLTLDNIEKGKDYIYYYNVDGSINVGDPYARLVIDSNNDSYIPATVFPDMPKYPTDRITGVPMAVFNTERDAYDWKVTDFKGVPQSDLIIYELLIRDFTGTEGKAEGNGTVRGVIGKLDYLKELGVNAIELLPIMEFNGNNSWGYNTNFYMAPDKAYGTPDDYRELIDGAHERGMAVILDIVFNQSDGGHPWYDMVRRNINPFYNGSAPHAYSVLNDWNQDCDLVQQQWRDALDYWMTAYKVDGFRFDLVKGLGNNDSYGNTFDATTNTWGTPNDNNTNAFNATRVARMKALRDHMVKTNPDVYFINENLAGAQEENDMARDGEINWANVNWAARNYVIGQGNTSLARFYAPDDDKRLWGSTVSYAESHDEERLAYNSTSAGVNKVLAGVCMRIGSMAAQMLLSPGAHMIWQFEELGNRQTTKNGGGNDTSPKKVSWSDLESPNYKKLHDTFAALCGIRQAYPSLFRESAKSTIELSSTSARYISLADGETELYLVVNPASEKYTVNATIPFPTNPSTGSTAFLSDAKYSLLATNVDGTPAITATGVTLPAGGFAVYGANLSSGIDDITADRTEAERPVVVIDGGRIRVLTPYTSMNIHTLSGTTVNPDAILTPGVYIVKVDSTAVKVAVM
ncbi:MAG: alpha-amylase family glycosyl hydrolase [Staphylococcus sp.]|nr:alpha-amylase family glycosyl hydrolase [Staphylococcus sp.]